MKNSVFTTVKAVNVAKFELRKFVGTFGAVRSTLLESSVLTPYLEKVLRASKKDGDLFNLLLQCTPSNASGNYTAVGLLDLLGRADVLMNEKAAPATFDEALKITAVGLKFRDSVRCENAALRIDETINDVDNGLTDDEREKLKNKANALRERSAVLINECKDIRPESLGECKQAHASAAVRIAA